MQHSLLKPRLLWLFLPAVAVALNAILPGSTPAGSGQLNLLMPHNLSANRIAGCKHDPYGPERFTTSLNHTLPLTPWIPTSDLTPAEASIDESSFAFDCFLDFSFIVFEIKGEIDSDLKLVFQIWLSILVFNYDLGVYRCSLLELDKDPCVLDINVKYFVGQAGLFPIPDADPEKVDLCFEVHGTFYVPYTRVKKNVNLKECFLKFPKPGDSIGTLSSDPFGSDAPKSNV